MKYAAFLIALIAMSLSLAQPSSADDQGIIVTVRNCKEVGPGETATHGGVTVTNNSTPHPGGNGPNITICTWTDSNGNTTTEVTMDRYVEGTISGLTHACTVMTTIGSNLTISGNGGTVDVVGSADGTVTSTGGTIDVELPDGSTDHVNPPPSPLPPGWTPYSY